MKYTLLIAVLLAGCSSITVNPKFPDAPGKGADVACPEELKTTPPDTTKPSIALSIIKENYGEYHICKEKVNAWIEWYSTQKKIFEEAARK